MPDPIVVLPLDVTGLESTNRIMGETHSPAPGNHRMIIPRFGAFFKESFRIYDPATNTDLDDDQWSCADLWDEASERSGKAVYYGLLINDPAAPAELAIEYSAYGGPQSRNANELVAWLALRRAETSGSKPYGELSDIPEKFTPSHHFHLLKHIYGLEYVVDSLDDVKDAIITGSDAAWDEAHQSISTALEMLSVNANHVIDSLVLDKFNEWKSTITLFQLGLDLMHNYPTANDVAKDAAGGSFATPSMEDDRYINLSSLSIFAKSLVERVVQTELTHLGEEYGYLDKPTRGSLLAAYVGAVFTLPSINSSKNIIANNISVYPKGYPNDDPLVITKLAAQNSGLACFLKGINPVTGETYLGILPHPRCNTPVSWYRYFFEGEALELQGLVEAHAKATSNAHSLTKDQLLLDMVEDLPVVTVDDIMARTGTRKYVTLDALLYHMRAHMEGATMPKGEDGKVDLDKNPMNDAKIIFAPCDEEEAAEFDCNGNKFPPKDQFQRSFCDGTDKYATFTDGKGGTYDKLTQEDSDDCKFVDIPAQGTKLAEFCDGFNKKARYADGKGGSTEQITKANDEDCGYIAPMKAGEQIAVFCSGVNQMVRYADGFGGYYDMPSAINTYLCGGSIYPTQTSAPGAPPGSTPSPSGSPQPSGSPRPSSSPPSTVASLEYNSSHTTVSPGTTETLSVTLRGGAPKTTYTVGYWLKSQSYPETEAVTRQITTDDSGVGIVVFQVYDDGVSVPRGTYTCWAKIDALAGLKSPEFVRTFVAGGGTTPTGSPTSAPTPGPTSAPSAMKVTYGSSHTTITPGTTETITVTISGGAPNAEYMVDLMLYSASIPAPNTRKGGELKVNTNSTGSGMASLNSYDDGVSLPRGVYQCWAVVQTTGATSAYFNRTFTGSAPTTAPPVVTPRLTYSTTHTVITAGVYEQITASLTNGAPNTVYTVELWFYSTAVPAPNTRKGGTVQISTNSVGTGSSTITSYDDGVALPRGVYESWAVIPTLGNLQSNHVNRTFTGSPPATSPPYNPATTYRSTHQRLSVGVTETITITVSGMMANTSYTVEAWLKTTADLSVYGLSRNPDGYYYYAGNKVTVTTNSSGAGSTQWSTTDNGSLPRGSYICWSRIVSTGTTSAQFTRTFV